MQVIYEDEDIVALNKPAGVEFDFALSERPELLVVHRLDKDTSGVILFAKNERTQEYMRGLFKTRQIQKSYLALVIGNIKEKFGKIELTIGRSKKTPLKRVSIGEKRGTIRDALTEYEVLKNYADYTYVEAFPKTGRTHQIRSHFAGINHPIVCDKLYSGKRYVCPGELSRQFLHAHTIEFKLQSGEVLRLEAEMPEDLKTVLQEIKKDDRNNES